MLYLAPKLLHINAKLLFVHLLQRKEGINGATYFLQAPVLEWAWAAVEESETKFQLK